MVCCAQVVKIWDVDKVTCSNTLFGHDGPVRCVQFDDEKIISGSDDHVPIPPLGDSPLPPPYTLHNSSHFVDLYV